MAARKHLRLVILTMVLLSGLVYLNFSYGQVNSAQDLFPGNTLWINEQMRLTLLITERQGDTFQGQLQIGESIKRVLSGSISGNQVSWLARDVQAIAGGKGSNNHGLIKGDTIEFKYGNEYEERTFSVRRSWTLNDVTYNSIKTEILPTTDDIAWEKIGWRPGLAIAALEAQNRNMPILAYGMDGNALGCT